MPGPEVITGSTRLKSGTAQKMVLNMLSTATMIKLGKVYGNLMVDVRAATKSWWSAVYALCAPPPVPIVLPPATPLEQCGYSAKTAILMILCKIDAPTAEARLEKTHGRIAEALNNL